MDFTREPIIETVITPKEGCKIVVRSSKNVGQEEYFVDSLEVVSFGAGMFFRSQEKPKAFLVPVSDYEILEVREARMVLKNVGLDRSIKIGGGREPKAAKEAPAEKAEATEEPAAPKEEVQAGEARADKKRDRRRQQRRRRGREEQAKDEAAPSEASVEPSAESVETTTSGEEIATEAITASAQVTMPFMSGLLPPPPTLISETIGRYKENVLFKNAFYTKEEKEAAESQSASEEASEEQKEAIKSEEQAQEAPQKHEEKQTSSFHSFWDDIGGSNDEPFIHAIEPLEEKPSESNSEEEKTEE